MKSFLRDMRLRQRMIILLGGLMYGLFFALGHEMERYGTCRMPMVIGKTILMGAVFAALLAGFLYLSARRAARLQPPAKGEGRFFTPLAFLFIFACYLPMYLLVFPGTYCVDTPNQLMQISSGLYSTNHPLLHTLLLKLCIDCIGLLGTLNRCAALYTLLQTAALALCFALVCASIARTCGPRAAKGGALFFGLYPLHMFLAGSYTKDVLFSGAFALMFALCVEAVTCARAGKRLLAGIVVSGALAAMLRHNMIYLACAWALILLLALKRRGLRVTLSVFLAMALAFAGNTALEMATNASSGDTLKEILSWPAQQMARARTIHPERFTQEEMDAMDEVILKQKWTEYTPTLSDPVKGAIDSSVLRGDPGRYLDAYLSVGKKCPQDYLDAVVALCYHYFYPYSEYRVYYDYVEMGISPYGWDVSYGEGRVVQNARFEPIRAWMEEHVWKDGADDIPVLGMLLNMGVMAWLMLLLVLREGFMGTRARLCVFLLPALLWFMYLMGPVMYARYIYAVICTLPVLAARPVRA